MQSGAIQILYLIEHANGGRLDFGTDEGGRFGEIVRLERNRIYRLSYHPDDVLLCELSSQMSDWGPFRISSITVWDSVYGLKLFSVDVPGESPCEVANFHPFQRQILVASLSMDGFSRYNATSGSELEVIARAGLYNLQSWVYSPCGKYVLTCHTAVRGVKIFNAQTFELLKIIEFGYVPRRIRFCLGQRAICLIFARDERGIGLMDFEFERKRNGF